MERVNVETDGPVRTVTLNRPDKRNAMDTAMLDALYDAFNTEPGPAERVVVIRAEGPHFCAGVDLAERLEKPVSGVESPVERVFRAMEAYPLPIVARVQGAAIAGGCELALHCEFVVAAETATFGMSLAQVGLAPTWFLAKKLMEVAGPVATREILLLGDPMPAGWMLERGLIARVVPEDGLDEEVATVVDRLAANAPLSLRAMKTMIIRQLGYRDEIHHADTDVLVRAARRSKDAEEGIRARLEKRKPVFKGE